MTLALGDDEGEPIPMVYLACRLTGIDDQQRQLLDSWCTIIEQAVTDCVEGSANPWKVSIHTPFAWSAPWNDHRPEADVFRLNTTMVGECSALIILCIGGGGLGVGQEFAWATALRLPVLLLHPTGESPSRQAIGTPADVTVMKFDDATQLADDVKKFLRSNRPLIEDWARRRDSLTAALLPLREALAERWDTLSDSERQRVQAESRVHLRRIGQVTEDVNSLAGASMSEILALVGAMNIDVAHVFANPTTPDLNSRQIDALGIAADEYEWSGADVLALERRARLELARGGTRRLSLVTPADWVKFRSQTGGHA